MKNKVRKEISIFTEEQIANIGFNETNDGVILRIQEADGDKLTTRLYLNRNETIALASELFRFIEDHQEIK